MKLSASLSVVLFLALAGTGTAASSNQPDEAKTKAVEILKDMEQRLGTLQYSFVMEQLTPTTQPSTSPPHLYKEEGIVKLSDPSYIVSRTYNSLDAATLTVVNPDSAKIIVQSDTLSVEAYYTTDTKALSGVVAVPAGIADLLPQKYKSKGPGFADVLANSPPDTWTVTRAQRDGHDLILVSERDGSMLWTLDESLKLLVAHQLGRVESNGSAHTTSVTETVQIGDHYLPAQIVETNQQGSRGTVGITTTTLSYGNAASSTAQAQALKIPEYITREQYESKVKAGTLAQNGNIDRMLDLVDRTAEHHGRIQKIIQENRKKQLGPQGKSLRVPSTKTPK